MDSPPKSTNTTTIARIQTRSSSRLKRKPFSDLTNTTTTTTTPPSKSKPKPVPESEPVVDPAPATSSAAAGGEEIVGVSAFTLKSKEIVKDFSYSWRVKTRRKERGDKEKAIEVASALSCPPLGPASSMGENMRLKAHVDDLHKAFSVPSHKIKRMRHNSMPAKLQKPILPPDFVEKQKAYFADIDAFELPEEEVSDDDELE